MTEVEFASVLKEHVLNINLYHLNVFYKILAAYSSGLKNGCFLEVFCAQDSLTCVRKVGKGSRKRDISALSH